MSRISLIFTSLSWFSRAMGPPHWSNWNFEGWFLRREENLKKVSEQGESSTYIWHWASIEPRPYWWEVPSLLPKLVCRDQSQSFSDRNLSSLLFFSVFTISTSSRENFFLVSLNQLRYRFALRRICVLKHLESLTLFYCVSEAGGSLS